MEHPNSITMSNIWHNHLLSLHEHLTFFANHKMTTTEPPLHYKIGQAQSFYLHKPSEKATISTSIAKSSLAGLK